MTLNEESGSGYRKTHLNLATSAWILHSTPYFFITLFPTAFYDRSRMTGKYLIPLKNRTHLYQILITSVLFYHSVRHRILPSFKNDGQVFNTVLYKIAFYSSSHTCPFRRLLFCNFSLFANTQMPLFCVRHFGIFCFFCPYFLVFRRKNICLLFENRHFFYFYSSLISVIL